MRSIVTVSEAATNTQLTTLATVKAELGITDTSNDTALGRKIDEASAMIVSYLGYPLSQEIVVQTIRADNSCEAAAALYLERTPIVIISSVVADGVTLDDSEYDFDAKSGALYRLGASGVCDWRFSQIAVTYTGGYVMPADEVYPYPAGDRLDQGIESAAISLVQSLWFWKGRDPLVKSEDIPNIRSVTYWVGDTGRPGELPPDVISKLAPFKRYPLA